MCVCVSVPTVHQQAFISSSAVLTLFSGFSVRFSKRPGLLVISRCLVVFVPVNKEACCGKKKEREREREEKTGLFVELSCN